MPNNAYHRRSDSPFVHAYNSLSLLVNSGLDNYVASRSNRSTQTFNVNDPVVIKTCKLAETVVNRLLGTMSPRSYSKLDRSDQAMCELVYKMLYRYEITFRNMLKRSLNINRYNGYSAFSALVDDVLCDGPTWGRIAVLYAYGGCLVVDCRKQGLNEFANKMTNYIGLYVGDKAGHWIKKQGGWDKLIMLNNGYHRRSDSPFVQGYNPLNLVVNSGCDNYVASRSNRSTQTFNVNDPVVIKTCKLAETVVNRLLGTMSRRRYCKLDGSDQAMGELVDKMLYRNEIKFRNKLIRSLNINRNNGYSAFSALADDVLCDGPTWRRIAVLYAYGGYLVVDCRTQGLNEFANKMTDYIGLYVGDKAGHWIKKQEGWDGLIMLNNAYRRSDSPFMHAYNSLNVLVNSGLNYYVSSRSTQTFDVNDPVVIKACKLAETVVNHLLGTMSLRSYWKLDGSDQAMCEYVGTILWRYEILLRKMVKRRLKINRNNGYSAFSDVADDVLRDGPTWHRIAALYAYGGYLVVDCRKQGLYEFANEMTDYIGLYVGHQAGHWIKKQGGWESFVDWKVKQENFSYKFFKGLVVIGLVFAR